MIVNDLLKTYGYTRDRLNHFSFALFDPRTEDWINIPRPTADEYVYLCDRKVESWMESLDEEDLIEIIVEMEPNDLIIFRSYIIQNNTI